MERLSVGPSATYSAIEGSIHVGRYAPILPFCHGKRVLDIACGEGYGSWLLSQAGAQSVLGLDVSTEAISQAKHNFQATNLTFDVCDGGKVADRLQGQAFDVIVCIETIEHLQNPQSFLSQLRQLGATDCVIMISCPNDHWYYTAEQSNPFHQRKYTFQEFRDLATTELGSNVRWFAGTAAQGFVTAPIQADGGPVVTYRRGAPSKYVAVEQLAMSALCPPADSDPIDTATCSYFLGIWNPPNGSLGGGAFFPMSMNSYALREQASALLAAKVAGEQTISVLTLEKVAAEQTLDRLRRDLVAFRAQTASLRRENDVLAESVRHWRAEATHLANETARLANENVALREALATWNRRKERIAGLIPRPLWPIARWVFRRFVPRRTQSA